MADADVGGVPVREENIEAGDAMNEDKKTMRGIRFESGQHSFHEEDIPAETEEPPPLGVFVEEKIKTDDRMT